MFKLGKKTSINLLTLRNAHNPKSEILIKAVQEFISYTPIDFCILRNGGYRSAEEQNDLYDQGVSKCDGFKYLSKHQKGLAVDLVPWVGNMPTWETKHAFYLSGAFISFCKIRGYYITSGADWNRDGNLNESFLDPCHFEL